MAKPPKRKRKLIPRSEQLLALQSGEEFDVLIIGGGATGAGCALDAVTRGLKTALVESDDFASGTSSKSTKLIHGGVRYLQKAILGVSNLSLSNPLVQNSALLHFRLIYDSSSVSCFHLNFKFQLLVLRSPLNCRIIEVLFKSSI